jgi:hypothetical protein
MSNYTEYPQHCLCKWQTISTSVLVTVTHSPPGYKGVTLSPHTPVLNKRVCVVMMSAHDACITQHAIPGNSCGYGGRKAKSIHFTLTLGTNCSCTHGTHRSIHTEIHRDTQSDWSSCLCALYHRREVRVLSATNSCLQGKGSTNFCFLSQQLELTQAICQLTHTTFTINSPCKYVNSAWLAQHVNLPTSPSKCYKAPKIEISP